METLGIKLVRVFASDDVAHARAEVAVRLNGVRLLAVEFERQRSSVVVELLLSQAGPGGLVVRRLARAAGRAHVLGDHSSNRFIDLRKDLLDLHHDEALVVCWRAAELLQSFRLGVGDKRNGDSVNEEEKEGDEEEEARDDVEDDVDSPGANNDAADACQNSGYGSRQEHIECCVLVVSKRLHILGET